MNTEIIFHEGLHGSGVVVELRYGTDRVIFDFGAPFTPNSAIFDGTVQHRIKGNLRDHLLLGLTPKVDGVYPKEDLTTVTGDIFENLLPYEESPFKTGILISHMHLDHMSNIDFLAEDIPVYMSKDGVNLNNALCGINEGSLHKNIIGVSLYEDIQIGAIHSYPYFSDHPCYGSVGYLIKTPDKTIYYSGDIRYHGLQREKAFKELEKLTDTKIDLLILDGTSYSPDKYKGNRNSESSKDILEGEFSEASIYKDVEFKLQNSNELGIFNIYHRDMQLITALIDTVSSLHRHIVFEAETAYVIKKVLNRNVDYYLGDYTYPKTILDELKDNQRIDLKDVNEHPKNYFIQVSYKNILTLLNMNVENGYFFQLFGEPFGRKKGMDILNHIMELKQINYVGYSNVYSFNHAFPNHLSYLLDTLKAETVVVVHSDTPENLDARSSKKWMPEQGVKYTL